MRRAAAQRSMPPPLARDFAAICEGSGAEAPRGLVATCPACGLRLPARLAADERRGIICRVPVHAALAGRGRTAS